ncbi:MAG: polysaccharide biosynthesis protein [Microscillaceae bacterium]|nr:polysaccharide biosynthesis protein [Microscillaceae bacterium]
MGLLKKLAGETAVYGLTMVLGRTLNYLLVPIYTAVFAEGEYAVQAELYSYVAFLNVLYTYGMETAFFRYATKTHLQKTFNQIVSAHLFTSLLFSIALFLSSDALALGLGYGGQGVFLRWLAGVLALDTLAAIPLARLRLEGRAWRFGLVKLSNILLSLGLNLFFLVFCPWVQAGAWVGAQALVGWVYAPEIGVGYIFLANLLASGVQWLLLLPAYRGFRLVWHWPTFRPILWYAYPLVFTGLAAMISEVLDRPLLKYYLPDNFYPGQTALEAMGVYAACYKLSIFMSIGIQAFKYAAEPFFFTRAEDPQAPALFARVMHYFVIAAVFVWLFVCLHLDVFKWLFLRRESYWAGVGVVPILLLANLFLGVYYNLAIWFKLTEQTLFRHLVCRSRSFDYPGG